MWLFQCFSLFTHQLYLKSMSWKLGKNIYSVLGDTETFKILLGVFFSFLSFLALDDAVNMQLSQEKKILQGLYREKLAGYFT